MYTGNNKGDYMKTILDKQTIKDLFIDAFEGGSNHWYQIVEHTQEYEMIGNDKTAYDVIDMILEGNVYQWIKINAPEYTEVNAGFITNESIQRGEETMLREYKHLFRAVLDGDYDAEAADVFLQCVLFGEVIFG